MENMYFQYLIHCTMLYIRMLDELGKGSRVRVGSEYDTSPQRKHNAEIEIESIHAFERCVMRASRT